MNTRVLPFLRVFLWLGAIGAVSIVFLGQGGALIGQSGVNGRTDAIAVFAAPLADDNDNEDGGPPPAPAAPPPDTCIRSGEQKSATSADGRVIVTVPSTNPTSVRIFVEYAALASVPTQADQAPGDVHFSVLAQIPPVPGSRVDALVFQIRAELCTGGALAALPGPANLGIRYTDADAANLNKQRFVIHYLDQADLMWKALPSSVVDPSGANFVSATIMSTGFYALAQI